jgi:hypothetical protein
VPNRNNLNRKSSFGKLREFLETGHGIVQSSSLADYISRVHRISQGWQEEDWQGRETDEEYALNNSRLVGQAWFRGHMSTDLSLQPGLYRGEVYSNLLKGPRSPQPTETSWDRLLKELFDLEHEMRIDFTSYGHLLNEVGQAKSPIDWYFLMQHHGIPTRLLDWTTNALAALFFALETCQKKRQAKQLHRRKRHEQTVAVWMIDAYWIAMRLDDDWFGPLLPWSEDAAKYVPPLEKLLANMNDSLALLPKHAMPVEPPAIHPRVAAQEGRFVMFGRTRDLLDHSVRLEVKNEKTREISRVRQIRFQTKDVDQTLEDLAQLGVSRRTLFPDLDGLADFVRWKHFHKVSGYNLQ